MEIVIIGTEPPCVRCQTTFNRAQEVAGQFSGDIKVKKIAIHSREAEQYGRVEGGHTIAEVGNIKPDVEGMKRVLGELDKLTGAEKKNEKEIDAKLKELEQVLSPVKAKAKELGYLMTPVLVVNGQVQSMDYVPSREEIRGWLEIERRRS